MGTLESSELPVRSALFPLTELSLIAQVVAELVPQKELQPMAFSVMPLVWSIGSVFGPILGGALASPAKRYPKLFGENEFLIRFPFALPNLVAAVLFCIGVTTGVLFLRVRERRVFLKIGLTK